LPILLCSAAARAPRGAKNRATKGLKSENDTFADIDVMQATGKILVYTKTDSDRTVPVLSFCLCRHKRKIERNKYYIEGLSEKVVIGVRPDIRAGAERGRLTETSPKGQGFLAVGSSLRAAPRAVRGWVRQRRKKRRTARGAAVAPSAARERPRNDRGQGAARQGVRADAWAIKPSWNSQY